MEENKKVYGTYVETTKAGFLKMFVLATDEVNQELIDAAIKFMVLTDDFYFKTDNILDFLNCFSNLENFNNDDQYVGYNLGDLYTFFKTNEKKQKAVYDLIVIAVNNYLNNRNEDNEEVEREFNFFINAKIPGFPASSSPYVLIDVINDNVGKQLFNGDVLTEVNFDYIIKTYNEIEEPDLDRKKVKFLDLIRTRISLIIKQTDDSIINSKKFDSLSYHFYLENGAIDGGGDIVKFKISPTLFAMLSDGGEVYLTIDNEKVTKRLFKEFLSFTKKVNREYEISNLTGYVRRAQWTNLTRYMLKKVPDISKTKDYLIKVFEKYFENENK